MADQFSTNNAANRSKAIRDARDAAGKSLTAQRTQAMEARKKAAERPPNDDIGYKFRPKFWEPGY